MMNALIGFSGFVGSTILKQTCFESLYRSTNIHDIEGRVFDTVLCAGAPAQKWMANLEPEADLLKIDSLIKQLKTIKCKNFILISTVDVFHSPLGVDENTSVDTNNLNSYGLHRRILEQFVESHFERHLIVRLPGLVGPGLRKNIIFDFLNNNNVQAIDSRGLFQFYPMVNLWIDIQKALSEKLRLVHLTSAPISVADVSEFGFGRIFDNKISSSPAAYDFRTSYAPIFGGTENYQYSYREILQAIRCYAQSEQKTIKEAGR
jgi:hypothetical protein